MRTGLIALLIVLGLLVLTGLGGGCMFYNSYKTAISLDEDTKKSWADMEVVLNRRYDLIPNIVSTVKGYAKHESQTLQNVIAARNQGGGATSPAEAAKTSSAFTGAMRSLINVVNERYPELKANEQFKGLQVTLEGSENRVAEMRRRYNDVVRRLNTHIRGPIGSIAASWADVEKAEYFEADEAAQEVPKVDFDSP